MSDTNKQGSSSNKGELVNPPWWRLPIVWMVIAGPALVVVAGVSTAAIAIRNVDPVLDTSHGQVHNAADLPAAKARNHAANPTEAVRLSN